jgi:cytoskeletal protein CcmA (bactofilin family)
MMPLGKKTNETIVMNAPANNLNDVNRIAFGAEFSGDLATANDIRIDGKFDGRLYCEGRLVVGEKAVIKGDFFCTDVDFSGTMTGGNIYTRETLSLKGNCSVHGDLYFKRFQVELDAKFTGACKVLEEGEFAKVSAALATMLK